MESGAGIASAQQVRSAGGRPEVQLIWCPVARDSVPAGGGIGLGSASAAQKQDQHDDGRDQHGSGGQLADRAGQSGGVHLRSVPKFCAAHPSSSEPPDGAAVCGPLHDTPQPARIFARRSAMDGQPIGCPLSGRRIPADPLGRVEAVRLTEFRGLMQLQFGSARAPSVARDHVFSALGGLTADEALAAGEDPKLVWAAVCEAFDVSEALRYGLPD